MAVLPPDGLGMLQHHRCLAYLSLVQRVTWVSCGCRYVCDYTYYLSLHHGNGRAALIHVPPLSPELPASLLGKALQVVIQEMLADGENAQGQSLEPRKQTLGGSSQAEPTRALLPLWRQGDVSVRCGEFSCAWGGVLKNRL